MNESISFSKCSASATYDFVVSSVDVDPYPIQKGKDATVTACGVSANDVTVTKLELKYSFLSLDFAVSQACQAGVSCCATATSSVSGLLPVSY